MSRQHWQDWIIGVVGLWLIASPWTIATTMPEGVSQTVVNWNFIITGVVAVILAAAALASFQLWEEWADVIVGLWLVASPWLLHFTASPSATWNAVIAGAVLIVAAGWNMIATRQMGTA
ncbi:SPW repeat protein [Bradyrhizobium cenepequi]